MRFSQTAAVVAIPLARATAMAGRAPVAASEEALIYDPPLLRGSFIASDVPGKVDSRSVLDLLLGRRQTCSPGAGYCSAIGICCPESDRCCSYGYCLEPGKDCCPNGPCGVGKTCCGYDHCHPEGTECCGDESYCEAGNICVKYERLTYDVCCTDLECTAHVEGGVTITRTTTAAPTTTREVYVYYYFYITWTYYVYYWYYSIAIDASVVTSSITTTTSTVSIRASDSAAASSSFEEVSATISLYTPLSATSLSSLAGSTSFLNSDTSTTTRTTGRTTSFGGVSSTGSGPGFGASAGNRVGPWGDYFMVCFFTGAAAAAALMVAL